MRVCLDTNVLVQAFSHNPAWRPLLNAMVQGRFEMVVSNEMMTEYQEVVTRQSGSARWNLVESLLSRLFSEHGTLLYIEPHFRFQVITADPDDNKFVDCAIAAQADFIVTDDEHFGKLRTAGYRPQPIKPADFIQHFCQPKEPRA